MITEISKIVTDLLNEPRSDAGLALLRTLNRVQYSYRSDGCFFLPEDEAFRVPELSVFLHFAQRISAIKLIAKYAILDYWLPQPYINALYLSFDDDRAARNEIRRYAARLTTLYNNKQVESMVFDSNKVMGSARHYESFILSRTGRLPHQFQDEYWVDLSGVVDVLKRIVPDEMDALGGRKGSEYINALTRLYKKIHSSEPDHISDLVKHHTSPLVRDCIPDGPSEVQGIRFEDPHSAFLTYLAFFDSIVPAWTQEWVYFPVEMVAAPEKALRWVGGLLLPLIDSITREQRVALGGAAGIIVSSFYSSYADSLLMESLHKSARAQIMSRNMSHNLGSHALARIKSTDMKNASKDSERLLGYLQERMDFVARVATEWPSWKEPVLFYGDLIRGFLKQGLLLNNLVADDGYTANQIKFCVSLPAHENPIRLTYKPGSDGSEAESNYSEFQPINDKDGARKDVLVAIPGGPVGRQAFYGFLENSIRNAAKHNQGRFPLEVALDLEEYRSKDGSGAMFYRFRYQDSISVVSPTQLANARRYLSRPLVDEATRRPVEEAWGIQEMKVYARYLAYPLEEVSSVLDENNPSQFLVADSQPFRCGDSSRVADASETGNSKPDVLTYSFVLQRPALALLVGAANPPADQSLLDRYGLDSLAESDMAANLRKALERLPFERPGLLYIVFGESDQDQLTEWLERHRLVLPPRVLLKLVGASNSDELRVALAKKNLLHAVRLDENPALPNFVSGTRIDGENAIQRCLIDLYRRWLIAFANEREVKLPINLIVYFDREDSPFPTRWAELRPAVESFGLDDVLRVFPINKTNVASRMKGTKVVLSEPWNVVSRYWSKSGGFVDGLTADEAISKETWLVFDNHGAGRPSNIKPAFYQYVGAYAEESSVFPNNREAFDRLTSVPTDFVGVLSLMQLVEASLLKVLILDERVVNTALEVKEDRSNNSWTLQWREFVGNTRYGREIADSFRQAGIWLAPFFKIADNARFCVLRAGGEVKRIPESRLIGEVLLDGSSVIGYRSLGDDNVSSSESGQPFDAVVVHKGLVEWLGDSVRNSMGSFSQEKFLKSLHAIAGRVIVTSGRGAQMDGNMAKYPFAEFAVLESYVVRELSKPSLANVLMSVSGQSL